MKLDFENATENLVDNNTINKLKNSDGVIIFGAGDSGSWSYKLLKSNDIEPVCFVDNYEAKWGKEKMGLTIYPFDEAMILYPNASICIASMWFKDILNQILDKDASLESRTFNLLSTMGWETTAKTFVSGEVSFIKDNIENFENLYDLLEDAESRSTLEGVLNYRLTRNIEYIREICSNRETYFDDELIQTEDLRGEVIDGGAFDGDTVADLIGKYGVSFAHLYAFEIEPDNCKKFRERQFPAEYNIELIEKGLGIKDEVMHLDKDGLSATCTLEGDGDSIQIMAIDELNLNNLSFVKMDIEGAERDALRGGINTFRRTLPVLAICAYHLQDDLLVLSDILRSISPDYKLYLRHYMECAGDTVMYAIPR